MNQYLKKFIEVNEAIISNVLTFLCSSGENIIYIFINNNNCVELELVTEARYDGETSVYLLSNELGLEESVRRYVPTNVKI